MATEVVSPHFGESRRVGPTKGFALAPASNTVLQTIALPPGTKHVSFMANTFATGVVAQVGFCPWATVIASFDNFATPGQDLSETAQDGDTNTDIDESSSGTIALGDSLWVGCDIPFRGVEADVDAPNGTANTIAAHDSSTRLNYLHALPRLSTLPEYATGERVNMRVKRGPGGSSGIEGTIDAGTGLLLIRADGLGGKLGN